MRKSFVENIEEAIIATLKSELDDDFFIAPYPDDPDGFDFTQYQKSVLVHYTGSQHAVNKAVGANSQSRQSGFAIHLAIRNLRGSAGSYGYIDRICSALQTNRIEGGQFFITSDALSNQTDGLWHWIIEGHHSGVQAAKIKPRLGA